MYAVHEIGTEKWTTHEDLIPTPILILFVFAFFLVYRSYY